MLKSFKFVIEDKLISLRESKLFNDSFWALIGNIASRGFGLIGAIFVARFLGSEIYGEYGVIKNTLLSVAVLSSFGLGYTATKFVAEYKNNKLKLNLFCTNAIVTTLLTSGLLSVLLFSFSNYISISILNSEQLTIPLRITSVWVVFNALTTTQIGILSGLGVFKRMAKINTWVGIVTFILTLLLTYFYNLSGALGALLISQIFNWYLNLIEVRKYLNKNSLSIDKVMLKSIIYYSTPVALQEAVYSITSWVNYYLLIELTDYRQVGLFSAAIQWSAVILFIPGILRNVILSNMSESYNNELAQNKILNKMLLVNLLSTIIPWFLIFIFSNFIATSYGSTYKGLKSILNITVFTTIFVSLSNVYVQAYLTKNKNWLMFFIRLSRDIGIVVLTVILINSKFAIGGALSLSVSMLIMSFLFLIIISLYYRYYLSPKKIR